MKIGKKKIEKDFNGFDSKGYLNEYYSRIGSENLELLKFFAEAYKDVDPNSKMLEFSGGPTIYQLITASGKVKEIHFSDYLKNNLKEVKRWVKKHDEKFDWQSFIENALVLEGAKNVNEELTTREENLRKKIKKFLKCDAFKEDPIHPKYRGYYDVVSSNFVSESITNSKKAWKNIMRNITSMLKDGGVLIITFLKDAEYYKIGDKIFPAANIHENDVKRVLKKLNFDLSTLYIHSIEADVIDEKSELYEGYKGMMFVKAKKFSRNSN